MSASGAGPGPGPGRAVPAASASGPDLSMTAAPVRRVILLHGVWMVGATMRPLAARLRAAGFLPEILGYRSILGGPEAAVPRLLARLRAGAPAHLVGHSLGGLVALEALNRARPEAGERIDRVLCLGTPLCGSGAARALGARRLTAWYLGRSAPLLLRGCTTWPPGHAVGMIAGRARRGLGGLVARLEGEHDGTVAVAETRAPGLAGHRVLAVSHNGLLWSRAAAAEAACFLRRSRFEGSPDAGL